MTQRIDIQPTGAALGADVKGVDFADLDEPTVEAIRTALREHLVLRFRGTDLSDADYLALGRRLGEVVPPEPHTRTADQIEEAFPEISVISNVTKDGVSKGEAGASELLWHTDHGFAERPAAYTMLLAREVPPNGGDTSFVNMVRAHDEMPDDLRDRAASLRAKHQGSHSTTGTPRPGYADIQTTDPREFPGAVHPILRTHPETGRKALYLGRRFGGYIPPLSLEESEALLDALWAQADRDELTWTQSWQVGDLVIWDNRTTMHRRDGFAGQGRRRMHRLMTLGERPV
ncbi:MAG: TauD/TfdA family dioxygenase [Pseudomonadota bacterium]